MCNDKYIIISDKDHLNSVILNRPKYASFSDKTYSGVITLNKPAQRGKLKADNEIFEPLKSELLRRRFSVAYLKSYYVRS